MTRLNLPTFRIGLLLILLFVWDKPADAQLPTAVLRTIWPVGAASGERFPMIINDGDFLDEASQLAFSHPGIIATLQPPDPAAANVFANPRWGNFDVTVAEDVPEGFYDAFVSGFYGTSNARRFWVTHYPLMNALQAHQASASAIPLALPQVIQSRCVPQATNYYLLKIDTVGVIDIDIRALRLDSKANIVVAIEDSNGKELQRIRAAKDSDPRIKWTPPQPGIYFLQVHDHLFRGGNEYFYQLQVREADPQANSDWQMMAGPTYSKPIDSLASKPIALSGVFTSDNHLPTYDFAANAGEIQIIEVLSASVGAATDPQLVLYRVNEENGQERLERLLEIDDVEVVPGSLLGTRSKDPLLRFNPPASGLYRVLLRDLQVTSEGDWDKRFWLSVRSPRPDFKLLALGNNPAADRTKATTYGTLLRRGEKLAIEVAAVAIDGFFEDQSRNLPIAGSDLSFPIQVPWQWPLDIRVDGLPQGVTFQGLQLNVQQARGYVILAADETVQPWTGPIQIVGHIEIAPQSVDRPAQFLTIQWPDPSAQGLVPTRTSDQCLLTTTNVEKAPLQVRVGDDSLMATAKKGATVDVPIHLTREEMAKGKITIRAVNLPVDVRMDEVALEGETIEGTVKFQVGANAPVGTFTIHLNAETDLPWPRNVPALLRAEAQVSEWDGKLQALMSGGTAADAPEVVQLQQQLTLGKERIQQLKESTKAQNTKVFAPSNSMKLVIEPQ